MPERNFAVPQSSVDFENEPDFLSDDKLLFETVENGNLDEVLELVDKSKHKELALKLIDAGYGEYVDYYSYSFENLDLEVLLKLPSLSSLALKLGEFKDLEMEAAERLINEEKGSEVSKHIGSFKKVHHKELLELLIKSGNGYYAAQNLFEFTGIDLTKQLALELIKASAGSVVAKNLLRFVGLDNEVALSLVNAGEAIAVGKHLSEFEGLKQQELVDCFIQNKRSAIVIFFLEKFIGLNHQELASQIIQSGEGEVVGRNLNKFNDLNHNKIALQLIDHDKAFSVVRNIQDFEGLNSEVALKLVDAGEGRSVVQNFDRFENPNHKKIALILVNKGEGRVVTNNLKAFKGLDKEVAISLIKAGLFGNCFELYIDVFNIDELPIDLEIAKKLKITISELYSVQSSKQFSSMENRSNEDLFDLLTSETKEWKDVANIADPFKKGAEIFGYHKMFDYCYRKDISRHGALHGFHSIISMFEASGLSSNQFANNILSQVKNDTSTYDSGTSYEHLNSISASFSSDIDSTLRKAQEYKDIPRLQELVSSFKQPKDIFVSWGSLKKYDELSDLLGKTDILEDLKELKATGKEQLYSYIETLAFHPNSRVSINDVMSFWRSTEEFLDVEDTHSGEVHARKKPSNYIEIPNLDLTAEELRDALVEGKLDVLQVFHPLQIDYEIPVNDEPTKNWGDLELMLKEALGKGIPNVDRKFAVPANKKELLKEFHEFAKKKGYKNFFEILRDKEKFLDDSDLNELETIYYGENGVKRKSDSYIAKVSLKSDPDAVLAGNDTACCMPFGSGKNNVYMFNPDTVLFTVQIKRKDGSRRTIAQSVMHEDIDIGKSIPDVIHQLNHPDTAMNDVVPENILYTQKSVALADNVEVAMNFRDEKQSGVIERIYRDFWTEYMKMYAKEDDLEDSFVPIGQGYSVTLGHLPSMPNTFAPLAPVGYSDNTGDSVYKLELWKKQPALLRSIDENVRPEISSNSPIPKTRGINYLTFRDSLQVAYIEGKAYSDNESMMAYLHNMENALIAKDINNVAKGRPNMSIKYVDDAGKMRGYLLAYEGRLVEAYDDDSGEEKSAYGERIIYVSDLASSTKTGINRAGASLINGFAELYKVNYLDKNDYIPIYAEAREETSYKLLKRQIKSLSEKVGIEFEIEELEKYNESGETMHVIMIRPIST